MPFTFSHPAVVLPLHRLFGSASLTGLVVGSMAPDFEKFIKLGSGNTYSHTLLGVFWFSLPISILIALVFHLVVRNTLIDSLPGLLRRRFSRYKNFNWVAHFNRHYKAIILSIVVGALTHLLWDAFTHKHSFVADLVPQLRQKISFETFSLPVYLVMQLISSLFGLLYILYVVYRMLSSETPAAPEFSPWLYWLTVMLIMGAVMGVRFWVEAAYPMDVIFTTIAAFLLGITLAPFLQPGKRVYPFWQA
ncbi:DUF4184 family protein [Pontibacter beigongshangensis]|uniref:DUF4184 family protein n=1 Tax=Pontibacter beigongshangensis TaxID=2574733 RepID=UPI00164FDEB2|nr:DUF4184 family protein [Pontibacter beigongshangensis]